MKVNWKIIKDMDMVCFGVMMNFMKDILRRMKEVDGVE
jgi:hypothetical protein